MSKINAIIPKNVVPLKEKVMRTSVPLFSGLGADTLDLNKNTVINNGYLSDVVFAKAGKLFSRIKASYQGKEIASTKDELYKQLDSLCFHSDVFKSYPSKKEAQEGIRQNIKALSTRDPETISRLSKFFTIVSPTNSDDFQYLQLRLIRSNNILSNVDALLNRQPAMDEETILKIASKIYTQNQANFDILVAHKDPAMDGDAILSFVKGLPMHDNTVSENIELNKRIQESLQNIKDSKIKEFIESRMSSGKILNEKLGIPKECYLPIQGFGELNKLELLLDAYHSVNNDYSMVGGRAHNYFRSLQEKTDMYIAKSMERSELEDIKSSSSFAPMNQYHSAPRPKRAQLFNEAVRLEPLKEFISVYSDKEPEMAAYLYDKYFLSKIPEASRAPYQRLQKEFGTFVFTENSRPIDLESRVYFELDNWRQASSRTALYPPVIDLSHAKAEFISTQPAVGFYSKYLRSLNFNHNSFLFFKNDSTFRHEMAHLNDKNFSTLGTINGIDFKEIKSNKLYSHQLKAAGLHPLLIDYAYTNKREFVAVAATGVYTKYSNEFKDVLVKLGMPEWVFKLRPLKN